MQLPLQEEEHLKTAFRPVPGMGLNENCRMPFIVTGAKGIVYDCLMFPN